MNSFSYQCYTERREEDKVPPEVTNGLKNIEEPAGLDKNKRMRIL